MVEFIDLDETQQQPGLPSVAMSFNGVYLEDEIPGYRTLNVSGRETISYDISTLERSTSVDGEIITGKRRSARVLEIQYHLVADTHTELQEKYRQLVYELYTGDTDATIIFNDDPETVYYGQLHEMGQINPSALSIVNTFTIYCQDPNKYGVGTKTSDSGNTTTIPSEGLSPYSVVPQSVRLSSDTAFSLEGSRIVVHNEMSERKIILDIDDVVDDLLAGEYIDIDISNNKIRVMEDQGDTYGGIVPLDVIEPLGVSSVSLQPSPVSPTEQAVFVSDRESNNDGVMIPFAALNAPTYGLYRVTVDVYFEQTPIDDSVVDLFDTSLNIIDSAPIIQGSAVSLSGVIDSSESSHNPITVGIFGDDTLPFYVLGVNVEVLREGDGSRLDLTKYLDYKETDFHAFKVRPGDTISVTPETLNVSVISRGVWY